MYKKFAPFFISKDRMYSSDHRISQCQNKLITRCGVQSDMTRHISVAFDKLRRQQLANVAHMPKKSNRLFDKIVQRCRHNRTV